MSTPYGFPSWTYGYTLCPQTGAQYYQPPVVPAAARGFAPRGRGVGRGQDFVKAGRGGHAGLEIKQEEVKPEPVKVEPEAVPLPVKAEEKEEGEIDERPIDEILKGRNAVMFCNDQSKARMLRMEWEQISETGPPHNKTFTWNLKMGDMETTGSANSKKAAKNKAAEEMARKLDKLPRPKSRFGGPQRGGGGFGFRGGFYGAAPPFYPPVPFAPGMVGPPMPPMPWVNPGGPKLQRAKKRKFSENGAGPGEGPDAKSSNPIDVSKLNTPSLNNPISKLYEYCKQKKLPEPIFETVSENVLEKRKTTKGFVLKKTEFTIQVEVLGKKFVGAAMTKKQAKYNASEAAWADLGGGVAQSSIDAMLSGARAGNDNDQKQ